MKYVMMYDKNDCFLPYMLTYVNEEGKILKWTYWVSSVQEACSNDLYEAGEPTPLGGLARYTSIAEAATIEELQLLLMLEN